MCSGLLHTTTHNARSWLVPDCQQVLGEELDTAEVLAGRVTPMYFGSAFSNFGVEPFLEVRGLAAHGNSGLWDASGSRDSRQTTCEAS
jgi:peptide subunit release factor RF-3